MKNQKPTRDYRAQFLLLPDLGGRPTWPAAFARCDSDRSFSVLLGRVFFELLTRLRHAVAANNTLEADRLYTLGDEWIEQVYRHHLSGNWRHWRFELPFIRYPEHGPLRDHWGEYSDFVNGPD